MTNPWLQIPVGDYETHMNSPEVAQLAVLGQLFQEALIRNDAAVVALLGCATGNGLEYLNPDLTTRITAVDINPEYLAVAAQRHSGLLPGLELLQADLQTDELEEAAYTLIFAGLLFEYIEPALLLPKIGRWLQPGGVLVTVLQLPEEHNQPITPTGIESLQQLRPLLKLVQPALFNQSAAAAGLKQIGASQVPLPGGKGFLVGEYRRSNR